MFGLQAISLVPEVLVLVRASVVDSSVYRIWLAILFQNMEIVSTSVNNS